MILSRKTIYNVFRCMFVAALILSFIACSSEEGDWEEAVSVDKIRAYELFLAEHPEGSYADKARLKIEQIYFERAKAWNTIDAYEHFLIENPEGSYTEKARLKIEQMRFERAKALNTINAYEHFLTENPEGSYTKKTQLVLKQLYFERAETSNMISLYKDFISRYPDSSYKKKAESKIQELRNERHPALRNTDTVKIVIKQNIPSEDHVYRVYPDTDWLVKQAGFMIVKNSAVNYDLELKITVRGESIGARYSMFGEVFDLGDYRYSGASINGTISLIRKKKTLFMKSYSGYINPPGSISINSYSSESDAPYEEAFRKSDFRQRLMDIFGKANGKQFLINVLKDGDFKLRKAAVKVLDKIKWTPENITEKAFYFVAKKKWNSVAKLGEPAVKPLISVLKNDDNSKAAVEALVNIGKPAVNQLISALKDKNDDVREGAAEALVKMGKPAVNSLITVLNDKNSDLRDSAADALGKMKDKRAVEPLIRALKDENPSIRETAADALAKIGKPSIKPLIAALKDKDRRVGEEAAYTLGKIGDPRTVEPLIIALKDEDRFTREAVAEALGEIGDLRAIEPLISALKDEEWSVRSNAADALEKITGKDFGKEVSSWQRWWEKNKDKYQKK